MMIKKIYLVLENLLSLFLSSEKYFFFCKETLYQIVQNELHNHSIL